MRTSNKTNINLFQIVQYSVVKLQISKSEYKRRHDESKSCLYCSVNILPVRAILLPKIV